MAFARLDRLPRLRRALTANRDQWREAVAWRWRALQDRSAAPLRPFATVQCRARYGPRLWAERRRHPELHADAHPLVSVLIATYKSGSLHYHEAWREILRGFAAASRRYVYVARLPIVHRAPSFVVIQRPHASGYDTEYPGWFFNREEFLAGARDAGLRLVREFLADERPYVHGAPEQCEFRGFLFEVG